MNIIEKKIKEIVPYENNPRKNDSAIAAVAKSIESFGFKVPIVIDKDGVIVCGHTRLKAAKKLKLSSVPCVVADDLTEEQIKAFRLADNKTAELADWDFDLLSGELLELDNLGIDMADFGFGFDVVSNKEKEYEQKKQEFQKRMAEGELSEDSEEYQEFLAKFEAKKTTDDCYTPENIYEVVADYVSEHYGAKKSDFVRPFYPGGNYQKESYKNSAVVVDNPPFSIISEICRWYSERNIKFFLFAPTLTIMGIRSAQKIVVGVTIIYENGAGVDTSFVTNMDKYEFRSAPELYAILEKANKENLAKQKKHLPKYEYPPEVVTQALLQKLSKYGVSFAVRSESCCRISELDEQKQVQKGIFGSGYLISENIVLERIEAERIAAERAEAERAEAEKWHLSNREIEIIKSLK